MMISLVRSKLLWTAVLPPIVLLTYIYKMDRAEKESPALLFRIFLRGVMACIPAAIAEYLGETVAEILFDPEGDIYSLVNIFASVALSEEFFKFLAAKRCTWRSEEFNYRFDGIIYAVFSSLGFATLENIIYVYRFGFKTGLMRAVLAIPGHMVFGVFMGIFYGKAREYSYKERRGKSAAMLLLSVLVPTILHGIYDYCIFTGTKQMTVFFLIFIAVSYAVTFLLLRHYRIKDYCILNFYSD